MGKICCVTGHREYPADKEDYIRERLYDEVGLAIHQGFGTFISGFANGVDLLFAEIVLEYRENGSEIFLEAAIPYAGRMKSKDRKFQELIKKCDNVKIITEKYSPNCYLLRNREMVGQSQRLIAVYDTDRPDTGTGSTMRYAHAVQVDTVIIEI